MRQPETPKSAKSPVEPASDALGVDNTEDAHMEPAAHEHIPVATGYAPGTGSRLRIFAGAFALILVVTFLVIQHIKGRDEAMLGAATAGLAELAPQVDVVKVTLAPPTEVLTLPGETRGWFSSTIYARVSGYVAKWIVDIGDRVKKDQVLAIIDTPELDAQLEAAQAQFAASEAEVKVREADVEFAKTTFERWQGSPKGVVSDQEREDKKARYAVSIAQLNAARARAKLDHANVDRLTYLTRFKEVAAPYDGVITERRVDIGDLVTAGSTANTTSLYGIAQSEKIRIFANVPQSVSVDIGEGTVAQVVASEYPKRIFKGKVVRTSKSIDPHARTLRVEVDLSNEDLALLPGMYVQVTFNLRPTSFEQVPASALLFRAGGPQVAIIDGDGKVKFQDVTIGRDNGNFVEIASGLAEGDMVALNISNQIADGDRVKVRDEAKTLARMGSP